MRFTYSKLFLLFVLLYSCKKDEVKFDATPSIEFVSISPTSAAQYNDPVTISIRYKDGDGDLGSNVATAENCFITDNRIGIVYKYRIQQLAPDNASIAIQGTLNIPIGGQIITDSSAAQSASYSLYITDRAGHKSNSISTGTITIVR